LQERNLKKKGIEKKGKKLQRGKIVREFKKNETETPNKKRAGVQSRVNKKIKDEKKKTT